MAIYTITIPDYLPLSINQLIGRHHMVTHQRKQLHLEIIVRHAQAQGVPRATGPRRVSLILTVRGGRRPDRDNIRKVVIEGLVASGALVDDNPDWCSEGSIEYRWGKGRQTEIILEDVDDGI